MTAHAAPALDTETLSRELTELDRLLHRIQAQLSDVSIDARANVKAVLKRTGGVLKDKITEDPVEWQRKIRAEWD